MDKKRKIILAATAAAVVLIVGAVALTQGARLKAAASVARSATMNEEQATAKSDESAQITQELQDEYQIPEITLTPEMQAAIADGTMTVEEAAAQLLSGGDAQSVAAPEPEAAAGTPEASAEETAEPSAAEETPAPSAEPEPSKAAETPDPEPSKAETSAPAPSTETETPSKAADASAPEASKAAETKTAEASKSEAAPSKAAAPETQTADSGQTQAPEKSAAEKAEEEKNAKVQSLFAQLYVLRDSFSSQVDGIIAECIAEYLQLDPSKQTKINRVRIVYGRMDDLEAMEADCNAKVEAIASQLDALDPALGEKARQYYENQKELKKASLIAQYGGD